MQEDLNDFVIIPLRIMVPRNIHERPKEVLKEKFRCERQANGSDLIVIYEEKQRPEYDRTEVLPSNPDNRDE